MCLPFISEALWEQELSEKVSFGAEYIVLRVCVRMSVELPIEDSAVLVFLSLSLISCRSESRSRSSGFSSFTKYQRRDRTFTFKSF